MANLPAYFASPLFTKTSKEITHKNFVLKSGFNTDVSEFYENHIVEACRILKNCFAHSEYESIYATFDSCKQHLGLLFRTSDYGYMLEQLGDHDSKLVGFISIRHDMESQDRARTCRFKQTRIEFPPHEDYHTFTIDNVCVDFERRENGLGKNMILSFIDEMIKHYHLERYAEATGREIEPATGKIIPPLLLGLEVDLNSPTMPDAFALYSKLGFVRWWSPCESIDKYDRAAIINLQLNYQNTTLYKAQAGTVDNYGAIKTSSGYFPTALSNCPLGQFFWDPESYLGDAFRIGGSPRANYVNFCMFKFYSDSFRSIAEMIIDASRSTASFDENGSDGNNEERSIE